MYKVRVTYDFKNDMMFSWFYHSILYHVDGQKYEDKTEISKLSKSKQKLYHSLYDLVLSDVAYVINEGWADYTVEPKDNGKGGLFILDIDFPENEKKTYDTYKNINRVINGYRTMLQMFFTIKIELGGNIGKGI